MRQPAVDPSFYVIMLLLWERDQRDYLQKAWKFDMKL